MKRASHEDTLVLVCDSGKALFFKNTGDAQKLDLTCYATLDSTDLDESLTYQDRAGRTYESHGEQRSSVGSDNQKDLMLSLFIQRIIARLQSEIEAAGRGKIIIAAPPRMLGLIRNDIPEKLRSFIKAEIANDLVNLPKFEIEAHLMKHGQIH